MTRRRPKRLEIGLEPRDRRTLDEVAREHTMAVLAACDNNQTNAARVLGIDRKTLVRALRRWGITQPRERSQLRHGALVAIEGLDGSGVTTQAKRLVARLEAHGHRAIYTCQPSDGPVGTLVRTLLANPAALEHAGGLRTLSLLFAADRVDHLHRVVRPALAEGTTVVSDRWYHSSLAYQRTGVERDWILALNRHALTPDVTIFLDVRPETGRQRRAAAGRRPEYFHDPGLQHEVAAGYRATIAELRQQGERIEIVDGARSEHDVTLAVLRAVGIRS
jgi:dTMP kinase